MEHRSTDRGSIGSTVERVNVAPGLSPSASGEPGAQHGRDAERTGNQLRLVPCRGRDDGKRVPPPCMRRDQRSRSGIHGGAKLPQAFGARLGERRQQGSPATGSGAS